jgi:membrane-associated phospholipid phosphatase
MLRTPLLLAALACGVALVVVGTTVAGSATPGPWDAWARAALLLLPDARDAALLIDGAGEPVGAVVLCGLLAVACLALRCGRLAVLAVVSQGVVGAASTLLKPVFGRTIHDGYLSYPSGHTAGATALAIVAALLVIALLRSGRALALAFVFVAVTVVGAVAGAAQIWLYSHYATDTVGGFCLAAALVIPMAWVLDQVAERAGVAPAALPGGSPR